MREEVSNWWEQAKRDLVTAKNSDKSGDYYAAVFFCQQAVEKGLKALYILKLRDSPGTTHSLVYLADKLKIPKNFFSLIKKLTPEFVTTRYPDVVGEVPYKLYDEKLSYEFIKGTEELIKWIESQMPRL